LRDGFDGYSSITNSGERVRPNLYPWSVIHANVHCILAIAKAQAYHQFADP
jgi:hypothetical protein